MALRHRLVALSAAPRLPRRTIRLRLTLIYGGLFLICGAGLLAITYVLVSNATAGCFTARGPNGSITNGCVSGPHRPSAAAGPAAGMQVGSGPGRKVPMLSPAQGRALASDMEALAASQHGRELHELLVKSGIALAIMAAISVALGWVVAGRVLRPLRTITAAARDISATSLHRRLALDGPDDELKALGSTFDDLLGRLEASFRAQRQFVANASHELRTPLAWQRTLAQVALADPDADAKSLRAAHERVLASGTQQERIIEALLTLSRGQSGLDRREPFDLAPLASQIVLARQPEAQDRQLDLYTALAPAPGTGDPRLAERLIANLVDNALRHNAPGGYVEVVTGTRDSRTVLSVINTGPVVPAAAIDRLLQPFQRLGPDRTGHGDGLGLGLSIVQAIAQAHGAALAISPQPAGGLRVEVTFPRPAPPAALRPVPDAARTTSAAGRLSGNAPQRQNRPSGLSVVPVVHLAHGSDGAGTQSADGEGTGSRGSRRDGYRDQERPAGSSDAPLRPGGSRGVPVPYRPYGA
jgi:signal transduction histidine kinase